MIFVVFLFTTEIKNIELSNCIFCSPDSYTRKDPYLQYYRRPGGVEKRAGRGGKPEPILLL
jgi:hypothetical protein